MATWQLSKRTIIVARVVTVIGLFAILLYILPSWLTRIPSVQSWLGERVSTTISEALNSPIDIERVSLNGWSELEVDKLNIYDSSGRKALHLNQLKANLSLWSIIASERIEVHTLRLFEPNIWLSTDSLGKINVQPILDALSSSDTTSTTQLDIHSILIRDGRVRYAKGESTALTLEQLNLKVNRLAINGDSVSGQIERLSLRLPNDFTIKQISGNALLKGTRLALTDITCLLPNSEISLPKLTLATDRPGLSLIETLELGYIEISTQDISPLYSPISALGDRTLRIKGEIKPNAQRIELDDLVLEIENILEIRTFGALHLTSKGQIEQTTLQAQQIGIGSSWSSWLPKLLPNLLPEVTIQRLSPIGGINYRGSISLKPGKQISAEGTLHSALGICVVQGQVGLESGRLTHAKAHLSTNGFRLTPLNLGGMEQMSGAIDALLSWDAGEDLPSGELNLQIDELNLKGQSYRMLRAEVSRTNSHRPIHFRLSSPQPALIDASGQFVFNRGRIYDISLAIQRAELSLRPFWAEAPIHQLSIEGLNLAASDISTSMGVGHLTAPKLRLSTTESIINLDGTELDMQQRQETSSLIRLRTPWLNAKLSGQYTLGQLPKALWTKLKAELPIAHEQVNLPSKAPQSGTTHAQLSLQIDSIPHAIATALRLPINIISPTTLIAHFDEREDILRLRLESERLRLGGHNFSDIHLDYREGAQLELSSNVHLSGGGELLGAQLRVQSEGNHLNLYTDLGLNREGTENGILQLQSELSSSKRTPTSWRDISALIQIAPSRLRLHTAYWDIAPATLKLGQGILAINGLQLSTPERSLKADGALALDKPSQGLLIDLKQINLRYILEAIGVDFDLLDTDLTGQVQAEFVDGVLRAKGDVKSPSFIVSGHDAGAVDLHLSFNSQDLLIVLGGMVTQPHGGKSLVEGYIRPSGDAGLDLEFNAEQLDVSFVGRFLDNIFSELSGYGTGRMRLHGLFKQGVTVEGEADIAQGVIGIRTLGTRYHFDHHLILEEDRVILNNVQMSDDEGNTGRINGYIGHRYFGSFDINLKADHIQRLKVLQTTSPKDMPVYGTAYASGQAALRGRNDRLEISVDLRSESGTNVTLDFNPTSASKDEQLIRFTRLRPLDSLSTTPTDSIAPPTSSSAIDLDLRFTITPQAHLGMNLAADLSNELRGHAEGVLTIKAPSQGEPQVYGSLSVLDGTFSVRIQQLAHKRFILRPNGLISFRGDPLQATMNLQAIYAVTANISDLDESLSVMAGRTNIPVHCILGLSGSIMRPDIRFGLELPGVDSDIERRVRSLLNTNDAIMRQMFSLIALGKFYTDASINRTVERTNDLTAAASSTISEQLSYLLGSFSRNIQFGTSIKMRNTNFDDTDIELLFSGSLLNDRLTFNGNVGYHDNPYLENTYMGEFDLEYKLNRSGALRLKGYNRYNNMYQYLRQSRMTQGFGVLFRQRFDRLSDLWRGSRIPSPVAPDTIRPQSTTAP